MERQVPRQRTWCSQVLSQVHGSGANEISRGERVERPGRPGRRRAVRARRAARRSRRSRRVRGRPSPPSGASSNHGPARSSPVGKSAHRQLDLRSEARATRPTARPGHRPGPRRIFPPRLRPTGTAADPVGTAAAAEPATTSSRRGLVARASASGDEGGGRGRHALIHVGGVSTRAMGGKDPRTGRGGAQGSQSERRPRRAAAEKLSLRRPANRGGSESRSEGC